MAEAKDPAARTMWSGEISLEQQCGISWDILHCRSNAPAAVVQQWGEGWALAWVGSSRSLIISMSHHRDNKDVCWDRDAAIWARAVLSLLFCLCSSLAGSLGYARLGWEVFGNAVPSDAAHPCPVWPRSLPTPPRSHSPSPRCPWMY